MISKKELLLKIKNMILNQTNNSINRIICNEKFILNVLKASNNDIDVFCNKLGMVYNYYFLSKDNNTNYGIEEIEERYYNLLSSGINLKEKVIDNGIFTHSCNGNMVEYIKKNGLGSNLNKNDELFVALNFLEKKLGITGEYTKQQSGRIDEVYFTAPGATSFGYACNFAPERLFLGILKQERDNSINVVYGENKIDYYRKVIYSKFGNNIGEELKRNIEIVLNGYFKSNNCIISFPVSSIINSDNIYNQVISEREEDHINLKEHIERYCNDGYNFFTTNVGSNSNANNMDNLIMINTVISPEQLGFLFVPDRYDLIQLIAKNKGLKLGEELDYFSFEPSKKQKVK